MDDTFKIPTELASTCLQIVRDMITALNENATSFADWLYQSLLKVVKASESKERVNREKMWCEFHKLHSFEDFISCQKQFMAQLKLKPCALFFQHVTQEIFESIITKKFSTSRHDASQNKKDMPRLTENEKNALRYVAGYVLKEVKNKLKGPKDDNKLTILKNLMQSDTQSSSSTSESGV